MKTRMQITREDALHTDDAQGMIEPLWWSVSIYDSHERYLADLAPFTLPQRHVFAIQWYLGEVMNGGHDQFFYNSTGIVWRDALDGLRAAGNDRYARILEEAAARMGGSPSFDRAERWQQMDDRDPDFEDLDREFYDNDAELYESVLRYIHTNANDFIFDGLVDLPD